MDEFEPNLEDLVDDLRTLPDDLRIRTRHHVREMFPRAVEAAQSTFLTSLGNTVHNGVSALAKRAADRLESQARRIEELEAQLDARAHQGTQERDTRA